MTPKRVAVWLSAIVALAILCRIGTIIYLDHFVLKAPPNGTQTPLSYGAPFDHVTIPSRGHLLDANIVRADGRCSNHSSVLIFHGIGETISDWSKAQSELYRGCISSMVFDYSGFGNSSRPGGIKQINTDSLAAYRFFSERFAASNVKCTLGHSMGNGPMLNAIQISGSIPSCVVIANAFSSLRSAATSSGFPRMAGYLVPDVWNNVRSVESLRSSVLVVHGDHDRVNPPEMGTQIYQAAASPKQLIVSPHYKHNDLYREATSAWWTPVEAFILQAGGQNTHSIVPQAP